MSIKDHQVTHRESDTHEHEPEEETKEQVQEKAEQAALDADWLYFKHYPWVYSSKTGSWYYLVPRNEGMIVWSQLSNQWQMMSGGRI